MTPAPLHERLVEHILATDSAHPYRPVGWAAGVALTAMEILSEWGAGDEPLTWLLEAAAEAAIVKVDPPLDPGVGPPDPPRLAGRNIVDDWTLKQNRRIVRCPACGDALGLILRGPAWLTIRGRAKRTVRGYLIPTPPPAVEFAGAPRNGGYSARDVTTLAPLPATVRCGGKRNDASCRRWWRVVDSSRVEPV